MPAGEGPHPAGCRQRGPRVERDGDEGHRGERAEQHRGDAHPGHGAGGGPRRPERHHAAGTPPTIRGPGDAGGLARRRRGRGRPHGARRRRPQLWHARPRRSPPSPSLEEAYVASLRRVADGPARTKGVAVGRAAGAAMLALRKDDGATRTRPIRRGWAPASGGRIRTPTRRTRPSRTRTLARGYAAVDRPRLGQRHAVHLLSASQFWLPGPPALTSDAYARDYNEVKSLGGKVSAVAHGRADRDRALLVRGAAGAGTHRPGGGRRRAASMPGTAPGSWPS